jgi:transcriptional regulator with XRE-family HTH domain
MATPPGAMVSFLAELMRRRKLLPSHLAINLGISHSTVGRWLSGEDTPGIASCQKLAEYSGVPLEQVLYVAGHLLEAKTTKSAEWPEFREYATTKYPNELDEDLITMIEDLIERRRCRGREAKSS